MDACERTRWHLQRQGLSCYPPGVKMGACKAPYIVVRGGGAYALGGARTGCRIVTLYCFVPRAGGDLAALVTEAKAAMRALRSQLTPTGNEGPEMIEQDYDARSQSIEYRVMRAE